MASAYLIAERFGLIYKAFWGYCGDMDAFTSLFPLWDRTNDVPTTTTTTRVKSHGQRLPVYYNVKPGFVSIHRQDKRKNSETCSCQPYHHAEIEKNARFYQQLRNSFVGKKELDQFVEDHFREHTVLALHIRAGNGESGDFEQKGRNMPNQTEWIEQILPHLKQLSEPMVSPVLFVATDTPSVYLQLQNLLSTHIPELPLLRYEYGSLLKEGQGVTFGEKPHESMDSSESLCFDSWKGALMEIFLLTHSDVVIAGRPSLFVQSAPLSIALTSPRKKYCEVNSDNQKNVRLDCYTSFLQWCCEAAETRLESMMLLTDPTVREDQLLFRLKDRPANCPPPPKTAKGYSRYCLP